MLYITKVCYDIVMSLLSRLRLLTYFPQAVRFRIKQWITNQKPWLLRFDQWEASIESVCLKSVWLTENKVIYSGKIVHNWLNSQLNWRITWETWLSSLNTWLSQSSNKFNFHLKPQIVSGYSNSFHGICISKRRWGIVLRTATGHAICNAWQGMCILSCYLVILIKLM